MAAPGQLVCDVRTYRCVGFVDKSKSAQQRAFGILRERIVVTGTIFMFIDNTADSLLSPLGFTKAPRTRTGIWCAKIGQGDELDALYATTRRLRCAALAIIVERTSLCDLASDFSNAGVITNSKAGFGRRAAQFSKLVARHHDNAALLTFDARSDVFRLYYNDAIVEDVITALENLSDYREPANRGTSGR